MKVGVLREYAFRIFALIFLLVAFKTKAIFNYSIIKNSILTSISSETQTKNSFNVNKEDSLSSSNIAITNNVQPPTKKSNFKANEQLLDPLWYLNKFGYLDKSKLRSSSSSSKKTGSLIMYPWSKTNVNTNTNSSSSSETGAVVAAIKLFQKYAKLNQTGVLDEQTMRVMKMPRCGHPDVFDDGRFLSRRSVDIVDSKFRKKRYALQGSKWPKSKLRFKVGKYPKYPSMNRDMIDAELKRAFDLWSEVSDVEFEQVKEDTEKTVNFMDLLLFDDVANVPAKKPADSADIDIRFETGYHGDSEPFDGSGLILGSWSFIYLFNLSLSQKVWFIDLSNH
jgi:hypothetical protein